MLTISQIQERFSEVVQGESEAFLKMADADVLLAGDNLETIVENLLVEFADSIKQAYR